jgi:glycosyltransferase involved in cell wall biosynthesis
LLVQTEETKPELSIVMPCLDEAETVADCVVAAMSFLNRRNILGEVVVGDNGSTDGSQQLARDAGARVVDVAERGYGAALIGGINAAQSDFIIMGDSDGSHDLKNLDTVYDKLIEGYDLVVGNRFRGRIEENAMPATNRYLGNPFLSFLGRIFFNSKIGDFHCGLRGFTKKAYKEMDLRTTGMEFASEMIVKSELFDLSTVEVPVDMLPSGRSRPPHLRKFKDGWRHLRFLLLYSPRWLFLYPGLFLILMGVIISAILLPESVLSLDIHTILYGSAAIIIGMQGVTFAILIKTFAVQEKLLPENPRLKRYLAHATLEKGIFLGVFIIFLGILGTIYALMLVNSGEFSQMEIPYTMRIVIPSVTFLATGFQIIFFSFFYSILKLKTR